MTASMRGELDHHTAGEMREQIDSTAKKCAAKADFRF